MQVSYQYVREHLDDLLDSAQPGEEIEIARNGTPMAKIIIMPAAPHEIPRQERTRGSGRSTFGARQIVLGAGRGELVFPTDEEWREMKEEDARLMNDSPLMTTGEI